MAWCHQAPSHYQNQCWLILNAVVWHSPDNSFTGGAQYINSSNVSLKIRHLKLLWYLPGGQWVNLWIFLPCQLPLVSIWLEVCRRMYDFFLVDHQGRERQYFNTLRSLLEIDTRFSESRCSKVLPQAERAYQEGQPPHYTHSYHCTKVGPFLCV